MLFISSIFMIRPLSLRKRYCSERFLNLRPHYAGLGMKLKLLRSQWSRWFL